MALFESLDGQTPLLSLSDAVDGVVDYKGQPVLRSTTGGWRSASFIIGVEIAERFAYAGVAANLITYLTGPLGQSVAAAAETVNIWSGASMLLTLLGAFVADSFLGRYRTIVFASSLYILGLGLLTFSVLLPTATSSICQNNNKTTFCSTPQLRVILFFVSLYVIAIGQGGHKPCVQAFGADQFDIQDPEECKSKSSFFNWWYFGVCAGTLVTTLVLTYIQENLSWSLGFGIPCVAMVIAFLVFVLGTKSYRYSVKQNEENPFVRIGRVLYAAVRNCRTSAPAMVIQEEGNKRIVPYQNAEQFKFLNKACSVSNENGVASNVDEVEEAKAVLGVVPIWITTFIFAATLSQDETFFTKQGATMDRTIISGFTMPAASLQSFIPLTIVIFIIFYDRAFVPRARTFTGKESGITTLQRIGSGMVFVSISMVVAALVEIKRLETAKEHGLVDKPEITIPMSFWWLVPQYVLFGLADGLMVVGLQEFFYDEVPKDLKSMGLALYGSIFGVGSFLSGFLVSAIDKATQRDGQDGWFANNLNKAHLDYFYWLLAGLSFLGFIFFLYFSKFYVYRKENVN